MRFSSLLTFAAATTYAGAAGAQTYAPAPASSSAVTAPPSGTSAAPAPPPPSGGSDSAYVPGAPVEPPMTHPQPAEYRVWRLVDPTEADWHAADPNAPRGWARMDTDVRSTTFYVGGSFRLADSLAFAPFAHLIGTVVEPNLALTWQAGAFWLMPAIGTSLNFGNTDAVSIDPQLFLAVDAKAVYFEGWAQWFIASAYHANATDYAAFRAMLLVSLGSTVGLGLEYDPSVATHNGPQSSLLSSIFGGRTNVRIGGHDTVGLFVGYQTAEQARGPFDGVGGRFEYVHQW